ncbi:hypothetical protein EI877_08850 [Campylobacter coli]|nr:hypothetical protein [Campylobacter coli]
MINKVIEIRKQVKNAIDVWNFDSIGSIYEKNFTNCDEIKMDYLLFLYETGQFIKLNNFIGSYNKAPLWWNKKLIDLDFLFLKNKINSIVNIDYKKINIDEFDFREKGILACYLLNCYKKDNDFQIDIAVLLLNSFILKEKLLLTKAYYICNSIDYFEVFDNSYFLKNTRTILGVIQNDFSNSIGGKTYYEKFNLNFNRQFFKDLNLKTQRRVALCIGGALRGNWQEYIDDIVRHLNFKVDIFLFSWNIEFRWIGLGGNPFRWVDRMLPADVAKLMPNEIATKKNFSQNFPSVFKKLEQEYGVSIDPDELRKIKNLAAFELEDQDNFLNKYKNEITIKPNVAKLYYGNYRLLQMVYEYQYKHNFQYDYIIKTRPDAKFRSVLAIEDIESLRHSDLMITHYISLNGTLDDLFAAGRNETMQVYLSLWSNAALNKHLPMFTHFPDFPSGSHDQLQKYCSLFGIKCIRKGFNGEIKTSTSQLCIPAFDLELAKDIGNCKLDLDSERLEKCIEAFQLLKNTFKSLSIGSKTRIHNQLSYKLGQAMIVNSKSLLGYIRMPFILSYIYNKHKQEQKIYQEKIKKDPSLKLPPLESYSDYKEALKEKECLTYKLGEALIKANKNWYGGGYIKLLLEIRKLKKEFRKKANHA